MALPPFPPDFRLYLASASPRRRELLAAAGIPFEVVSAVTDEELEGADPARLAETNALGKARAARLPSGAPAGAFVLAADTLVVVEGRILGKPEDPEEARAMLDALAGRTHEVVTGVALLRTAPGEDGAAAPAGECHLGSATTEVRMRTLTAAEAEAYVASGEWADKAGGYAVQGLASLLVEEIRGEYANVVGLPVVLVGGLMRAAGFDLVTRRWLRA